MEEGAMAAQYQVLEELGSGSFGVVYKAIERATGDIVAIKLVSQPSALIRPITYEHPDRSRVE